MQAVTADKKEELAALCRRCDVARLEIFSSAPRAIYDIPFLTEDQKRNILGRNAARLFNLPKKEGARKAA